MSEQECKLPLRLQADKRAEFDAVQQAWSVLGDEARRRAYDRELQTERTTSLRVSVVISLDDCDLDSGTDGETAVAACRCGAQFEAPLGAVERAGKAGIVVNCTSCSLKARIVDDMPTSPDAAAPAGDG
jgi:curved DNA-binding protein CbpA